MKRYLSRDEILAAPDIAYEDVDVPEWGGTVRVRGMTGAERDEWEMQLLGERADGKRVTLRQVRATLVAMTVVNSDGQRVFTSADVEALGAKSVRALQRVYEVALRLSRVSPGDVEDLKGN